MRLSRSKLVAAAGDNAMMRELLEDWAGHIEAMGNYVGYSDFEREVLSKESPILHGPLKSKAIGSPQSVPIPKPATWTVTGIDGHFIVVITNPDQGLQSRTFIPQTTIQQLRRAYRRPSFVRVGDAANLDFDPQPERAFGAHMARPIQHQLQSALNTQFDANSSVVTYGPDEKTNYNVTDHPDETRYWRFRSKYRNSDFNAWQYWADPSVCGVIAVYSGRLRSSSQARNANTNNTNNATVDSIDAGASATVRIYGPSGVGNPWGRAEVIKGTLVTTSWPAGTIIGQAYNTDLWVYYNTDTNSYVAFTTYFNGLSDNQAFAGKVHTVAGGGGGGIQGGGGATGAYAGGHFLRT